MSKDYGFQIPHAAITLLTIDNTIPTTEAIDMIAPPTNDIPIPSEEGKTWHLKLGILIEDELFPYVPTDPIYKTKNCRRRGKDPLTPGIKKGKTTKQLYQLELELAQFNIDYNSTLDPVQLYKCYEGEMSDDAKELEQRPHKRSTHHHIDSHLNHDNRRDSIKRIKIITIPDLFTNSNEGGMPSTSY
ncbi:uncharacterized protein OCT59_011502 [Rhizophagus irregularis]|uniref:uncharacterized protein n=1 Tax=Rhizophagus irregularis TaxID=588596 RepID=UPI00333116CF|nr:hypothetical protein OCT59_011502 [Rhizophagus irregularis]